jgi:hypothetical protein
MVGSPPISKLTYDHGKFNSAFDHEDESVALTEAQIEIKWDDFP